jgi:hypothetical protein
MPVRLRDFLAQSEEEGSLFLPVQAGHTKAEDNSMLNAAGWREMVGFGDDGGGYARLDSHECAP